MVRDLRGQRLLITGASGGIGRCLAEQAARAGARVAVTARAADKLDALARELVGGGAEVVALPADLTSEADRRRLLDAVADRFDGLVLLVLPGLTRGGLNRNLLRSEGRARIDFDAGMPPGDVAAGVLRALRRNRTETVLGRDARWMLRVHRFLPWLVDRLLARRVRHLYA